MDLCHDIPRHILRDVDVAPFQHGRLPQDLLPVIEIFEGDNDWSASSNVRASLDPGSLGDHYISSEGEGLLYDGVYLANSCRYPDYLFSLLTFTISTEGVSLFSPGMP